MIDAKSLKAAVQRRPALWLEVGEFAFETRRLTVQDLTRIQREAHEYVLVGDKVHEVYVAEKHLQGFINEMTNWRGVQIRHLTSDEVPGASPTDPAPFDRELVPLLVANVPILWKGISDAYAAESVRYAIELSTSAKNSPSGSDTTSA